MPILQRSREGGGPLHQFVDAHPEARLVEENITGVAEPRHNVDGTVSPFPLPAPEEPVPHPHTAGAGEGGAPGHGILGQRREGRHDLEGRGRRVSAGDHPVEHGPEGIPDQMCIRDSSRADCLGVSLRKNLSRNPIT